MGSHSPESRLLALDVLRAVAVLLVLGRLAGPPFVGWPPTAERALAIWARGGWMGVDLFFVLSGFLISGLLFREYLNTRSVSLSRFLIRRGLKIYPAFYVFLATATVLRWLTWAQPPSATAVLSEAVFIQNYGPALWPHTWSLAVEEHFYLLCSFVIWLLARRSRGGTDRLRLLPLIFVAIASLCLAGRVLMGILVPYADKTHLFPTHLRIDSLLFGVCLSYYYHLRRADLHTRVHGREWWLAGVGVVLLLPPFFTEVETSFALYTVGLTGLYLGSGLLVLALVVRGLPDSMPLRLLAGLGKSSYSVYLWHRMARSLSALATTRLFHVPPHSPVWFMTYVLGSVLGGMAMARLVELPVIRIRDRLFPATK